MNARRDSSNEPSRGSFGGRALLTAAVVFALVATGVLVLSDELKWLRLGIVAALWAALVGAFLAARYRRQVADQEEAAAERQERYELELEREVSARREYELEVAAEARRQADEEARDDIAALRQELFGLRQTLESLLGGEFLVERYALRAESTRMRSLSDDHSLKRLPPAKQPEDNAVPSVVQEAQTDLIEPVGKPSRRKVDPLPRRAERPNGRTEFPIPEHTPHPAEVSDRWFVPDGLGTNQQPPATPAESQPYAARQYVRQDPTQDSREQNGARSRHHTVASGYMEPVSRPRPDAQGYASPPGVNGSSGYMPPVRRPESSGYQQPVGRSDPYARSGDPAAHSDPYGTSAESSGYQSSVGQSDPYATSAESSGYQPPVGHSDPYATSTGSLGGRSPVGRAESSDYVVPVDRGEPPGRRRAPADDPAPDSGSGRRRRAEGQPSWQESRQDEAEPTGSHAAGRSVSELLASHGGANSPNTPRRRRRRED